MKVLVKESNDFEALRAITKHTQITEADKLAKDMVTVFEAHNKTVEVIRALIIDEVKAASK